MARWKGAMSLLLIGFLATFFGGCGPRGPIATPTPTKTPRPLVTPLAPTNTPAPTPTLTSTLTPTPDYSHCPFTGEPLLDQDLAMRRPLLVKIGNERGAWSHHIGFDGADIVFEHLTEGGITRFTALFLCQDVEKIGPVRSARLIDIPLAYMTDGILAHVGASGGVNWILEFETDFPRLNWVLGDPGFWEDTAGIRPWRTFTSTQGLWEVAEAKGWQHPMARQTLTFAQSTEAQDQATEIVIHYYDSNNPNLVNLPSWRYDPDQGRYLRLVNGQPHIIASTGQQVSAANVIVLVAPHEITDIIEDHYTYAHSVRIQLIGEGEAIVFRDGKVIHGSWVRGTRPEMISLVDSSGQPIPLQIGNSWIEVVSPNMKVDIK